MDRNDKRALMLTVVDSLRSVGSWCGDTHVQKCCYVLQTAFGLPTDFKFILYKHGPFSFDLQDYMYELRGDSLVSTVPTDFQYGTSLSVTDNGKKIESLRQDLVKKHLDAINLVSNKFGKRPVRELEKVATALFVTQELPKGSNVPDRAKRLIEYKKHVSLEDATKAVQELDELLKSAAFAH